MALKNCEHCGGEFEARASAKFCSKSCSGKAHYATNKAAYLDKAKAQRERDPEGMAAYHAAKYDRLKQDPEWLAARRTYNRAHYAANRGHKLAYGKTYYETHKESLAAYHRTRYATDKDRVLAIGKAYVSAHPEKNRAKAARYRAAKLNSTPPWQPREELDAI
jgi:hypothetical protein